VKGSPARAAGGGAALGALAVSLLIHGGAGRACVLSTTWRLSTLPPLGAIHAAAHTHAGRVDEG
jgi:hypothetical protein